MGIDRRQSLQTFSTEDEYILAMREDISEWLSQLHKVSINARNFLEALEDGVLLCRHARAIIDHVTREEEVTGWERKRVACFEENLRQYKADAKRGSFQARDNVAIFISWCRNFLRIHNSLMFETEDLIGRKNERHVILCLLEIARRGYKLGLSAPTLVYMECQIDDEIKEMQLCRQNICSDVLAEKGNNASDSITTRNSRKEELGKNELKSNRVKLKKEKMPSDADELLKKNNIVVDMKSLDELVRNILGKCSCPNLFPMVKVSDGRYRVSDSQNAIFVRVLRNHVMVRIGGGWDTLDNYLNRHDPCRCNYRGHKVLSENEEAGDRILNANNPFRNIESDDDTSSNASLHPPNNGSINDSFNANGQSSKTNQANICENSSNLKQVSTSFEPQRSSDKMITDNLSFTNTKEKFIKSRLSRSIIAEEKAIQRTRARSAGLNSNPRLSLTSTDELNSYNLEKNIKGRVTARLRQNSINSDNCFSNMENSNFNSRQKFIKQTTKVNLSQKTSDKKNDNQNNSDALQAIATDDRLSELQMDSNPKQEFINSNVIVKKRTTSLNSRNVHKKLSADFPELNLNSSNTNKKIIKNNNITNKNFKLDAPSSIIIRRNSLGNHTVELENQHTSKNATSSDLNDRKKHLTAQKNKSARSRSVTPASTNTKISIPLLSSSQPKTKSDNTNDLTLVQSIEANKNNNDNETDAHCYTNIDDCKDLQYELAKFNLQFQHMINDDNHEIRDNKDFRQNMKDAEITENKHVLNRNKCVDNDNIVKNNSKMFKNNLLETTDINISNINELTDISTDTAKNKTITVKNLHQKANLCRSRSLTSLTLNIPHINKQTNTENYNEIRESLNTNDSNKSVNLESKSSNVILATKDLPNKFLNDFYFKNSKIPTPKRFIPKKLTLDEKLNTDVIAKMMTDSGVDISVSP